jgi:hypothetical protein
VPLPMVHLTVAASMLAGQSEAWASAFVLGSLAPDAIHMRQGTTGDDKRRTHLQVYSTLAGPGETAALLGKLGIRAAPADPYLLGYVSHLLTDGLWRALVWLPMQSQLPPQMSGDEQRRLYYRETDEIDRMLYERMRLRPRAWNLLAAATARDISGLLSAHEVALWRERTLHWFERLRPASEPLVFLSVEQTLSFADDAADQVIRWLDECGVWSRG